MQNLYQKLLISSLLIQAIAPAQAQITPDSTLGAESSQLNQNVLINNVLGDKIDGGATRGSNLFHSFSQFNINDAQRVYFANPSGVLNILTRVTGGNGSNIFGTLGVDGGANLFLINPNGILFGQNARLDVGGSFVGTTANRIQFGNQGFFSATNPEAPALLTINPSALVFNQINPNASIENNSVANLGLDPSNTFTATGLRVPDGNSLLLVGGDIEMNNGRLYAFGGRVELGGLAAPGTVGLSGSGSNLSLSFPDGVTRSDVSVSNLAGVGVAASNGGSIGINARNLELAGGSFLYAGIGDGLGTVDSKAGNIDINAQGAIEVKNGAQISVSTRGTGDAGNVTITARDAVVFDGVASNGNTTSAASSNVEAGAVGKAGDVNINAGSIEVKNGAQIHALTRGTGDAGNVTITARDAVVFDGIASNGNTTSGAFSSVEAGAVGKAGDVNIDAGSIEVKNGAQIYALTRGTGDAGNVTITARDAVSFDGAASNGNTTSSAFSSVEAGAEGKGGTVNIDAGSLSLTNGGQLAVIVREADTSRNLAGGRGIGGSVNVKVRDAVTISGESANGTRSGIFSSLGSGAEGRGGNINIEKAGSVSVTNGGQLSAETSGKGDAGNITINSQGLVFLDNGINNFTGAYSNVYGGAVGNGGTVNIDAGSIEIRNGAQINAVTRSTGDAGNVTITARDAVVFDGAASNGNPSAAFSNVEAGAVGNGGTVNIDAGSLSLTNGGLLGVFVREANISSNLAGGQGDGGSVNLKVRDAVTISGESANGTRSGIYSSLYSGAVGRGGNITIEKAGSVGVTNGGQLSAETSGTGNAGNITINSQGLVFFDQASSNKFTGAFSNVYAGAVGNGGTINIDAGSVEVKNGAQINALTRGTGDAGNVTITARDAVSFDGVASNGYPSAVLSTVDAGAVGNGGTVNIDAGSLSLTNGGGLGVSVREADTSNKLAGGRGDGGTVNVKVLDALTISGETANGTRSGIFSNLGSGAEGRGGNINILGSGSVSVTNGGQLSAETSGKGDAGNITINSQGLVFFDQASSNNSTGAFSNVYAGAEGNGGTVKIDAGGVSLKNGTQINALTRGTGDAGNVTITARDAVSFDGVASNGNNTSAAFSSVEAGAVGNGGTVNIDAKSLSLTNGGGLGVIVREADTSNKLAGGRGDGGTVNVKVLDALTISGETANGTLSGIFSSLGSGAEGRGGNINILGSGSVSVTNGGQLSASTSGKGDAGNVTITARDAVVFDGVTSNENTSGVFSNVGAGAVGNGGTVNIDAGAVSVKNGAQINAFTRGTGDAGDVTITARDAVSFDGVASNGYPSAVLSTVDAGAVGNGGTVNIDAQSLSLTNGGQLGVIVRRAESSSNLAGGQGDGGSVNLKVRDAVTISGESANGTLSGIFSSLGFGAVGKGGNININDAGSLSVTDGARLTASTFGIGDAGDITINVLDAVSFDGADNTGVFSNANDTAVGNGGNIKIGARTLSITNGAAIRANSSADSVKNQGTGRAGNIEVNARSIKLDNEGNIRAESTSGNGGNITLEIGDLLLLRNNSLISTSASGAGDGGNITINAPNGFLVGVPNENSDIITNAVTGNGGKVNINAAGIYFLAPLSREELQRLRPDDLNPRKLQTNDITAISQEKPELSGQVNINTLNSDPNRGLFTLSTGVVEPSTLIASGCGAFGGGGSEFTVTGRGGLPPSPDEPLTGDAVWTDARLTNIVGGQKPKASVPTPSKANTVEIVPATGWVFNGKGQVTLISNVSNSSPRQIGSSPTCQQP
jgi:filamentous hemagglutinin family protein